MDQPVSNGERAIQWRNDLHDFIASERRKSPLPARDEFSNQEEWQLQIIAGALTAWSKNHLDDLLDSRSIFEKLKGFDPTPFIVILTSVPGLVATQLLWRRPQDTFVFLTPEEFDAWTKDHPDEDFIYHQLHWNYFTIPDSEQKREIAARFPELDLALARMHIVGDLYGPQMGMEGSYLWQWDGTEATLIEPGFSQKKYWACFKLTRLSHLEMDSRACFTEIATRHHPGLKPWAEFGQSPVNRAPRLKRRNTYKTRY